MSHSIRKLIFAVLFNGSLLAMLIIGIQNSSNKTKVNFIVNETIELPTSFIIGLTFVSGSILGNFINITELAKKNKS